MTADEAENWKSWSKMYANAAELLFRKFKDGIRISNVSDKPNSSIEEIFTYIIDTISKESLTDWDIDIANFGFNFQSIQLPPQYKIKVEQRLKLFVPVITNIAFASELMLKAIAFKNDSSLNADSIKNHKLEDILNQKIPSSLQSKIRQDTLNITNTKTTHPYSQQDINDAITEFSDAFYQWRYALDSKVNVKPNQTEILFSFYDACVKNF